MSTRPSAPTRPPTAPPQSTTSTVRRNLFSVSRRALTAGRPASFTNLTAANPTTIDAPPMTTTTQDMAQPLAGGRRAVTEEDEILVTDDTGGYAVESLAVSAAAAAGGVEEGGEGEGEGEEGVAGVKVDTRLIEMYRSHSRQQVDQAELKAAVQASLAQKVASLDEDRWMFEAEDDAEVQM